MGTKRAENLDLAKYRTLVFDCDGVILNSNPIKTDAFYQAALPYGDEPARKLREYHVEHGGISRYHKFDWFLKTVLGREIPSEEEREELLERYAALVWDAILECEIDEAIFELRRQTPDARWIVASGGDQNELRTLFSRRGLDHLFDGGIFGSPTSKKVILKENEGIVATFRPALFFGDSMHDYHSAVNAEIDFAFVSHWSEIDPIPNGFSLILETLADATTNQRRKQ